MASKDPENDLARARKWRAANPARLNEFTKRWQKANPALYKRIGDKCREAVRSQALAAYGNKCACCGETIYRFLTIDHINGTGVKNSVRKKNGATGTGDKLYRWLRANNYPPGFRVLCFNCNWAEGHGGCPHHELMRLTG